MKKDFRHFAAKNLKHLRNQMRLTATQMAQKMESEGMSMNAKKLEAYENSRNDVNVITAKCMATFFKMPLEQFLFTDLSLQKKQKHNQIK